ncbi:hypothetical protein E4T42_01829 [Aureobasidium subglaciale]|nr:hypothetical protein E4T42_01829 [Aureobasidium subglaciale]
MILEYETFKIVMFFVFNFFHVYIGPVWMRFFVELCITVYDSPIVYLGSLFIAMELYPSLINLSDMALEEGRSILALALFLTISKVVLQLRADGFPTGRMGSRIIMADLMIYTLGVIAFDDAHANQANKQMNNPFPP